jgi:MraZ protein
MFIGEYRHNIDAKGRIIIPAKFRETLAEKMIVTRGLDGCLTIYTIDQWRVIYEQLKKLPNTKRESRMYVHMITSKAAECELDGQGRILLPTPLLEEAAITKECVIVGVADHVEIWSKERWDAYYQLASNSFEEVAEQLTDFLI